MTNITLAALEGNEPTHLSGLQLYLAPHLHMLIVLWWVVFAVTLAVVIVHTLRKR